MSSLIVVDIGNSRMKWGRCDEQQVREAVSLSLENRAAWDAQVVEWAAHSPDRWVVAGVNPKRIDAFLDWLKSRGATARILDSYRKLPIEVDVEQPEQVGLDRLLNAVAAASRGRSRLPAMIVDAGSAVTVDRLDENNVFQGGAIFPGLRLMAEALHEYTAKLPLVQVSDSNPTFPGKSTAAAIEAGIHGAVVGGIRYLVGAIIFEQIEPVIVYLTGGDAKLLAAACALPLPPDTPGLWPWVTSPLAPVELWPFMTLEGIRIAAARLE